MRPKVVFKKDSDINARNLQKVLDDIYALLSRVNDSINLTSRTTTITGGSSGTSGYPVDENDTDSTKNKLVSNNLAHGWETNKHARQHALNSTSDHTSSIVINHIMVADANGLPSDSGKTTADLGVTWVSPPSSPTDSGNEHELAEDDNHLYVCIAANTWKRVALNTWTTPSSTSGQLIGLGLTTYA